LRYAARIDANQPEIVDMLRATGVSVAVTSALGDGFPDLVCAYANKNYLFEVKDPEKPPSKRKLTPDQQRFFNNWKGPCFVIENWWEATDIMGIRTLR
jgi:Holliday junction resolvase